MYVVTKRFGRTETRLKEFSKEPEAIQFIMNSLKEDRQFKVIASYGLYEGADLVREFTASDIPTTMSNQSLSDHGSTSQKSSSQTFAPSPFNTSPRLGPQTGLKDNNSNKDKDDK